MDRQLNAVVPFFACAPAPDAEQMFCAINILKFNVKDNLERNKCSVQKNNTITINNRIHSPLSYKYHISHVYSSDK